MRENALTDTYILNCYFEKKKKKTTHENSASLLLGNKIVRVVDFLFSSFKQSNSNTHINKSLMQTPKISTW